MNGELSQAKRLLSSRQDIFLRDRAANAAAIRENIPRAQELANEIRHTFLSAMSGTLINKDESAFSEAAERSIKLQDELAELLERNGYSADALYERPMCRQCGDTGYSGTQMCVCLRECLESVKKDALAALKVGSRSFDSFDLGVFSERVEPEWGLSQRDNMKGNLVYCRNWAKTFSNTSPNLFLNGGTGQGKTFLCSCIAKRVSDDGFSVIYVTAVSMFNALEDKRFDRSDVDVDPYYNCDLLIIDDLGTEMTTAFVQSALYNVINTRLTDGRKTIINANLTSTQLTGRYMEQICSRLLGEFKQLHFFGPDLRLR